MCDLNWRANTFLGLSIPFQEILRNGQYSWKYLKYSFKYICYSLGLYSLNYQQVHRRYLPGLEDMCFSHYDIYIYIYIYW